MFSRLRSTRHDWLARRLWPFAFGGVLAFLRGLLVAGERRGLGLFTLVPRITAIAGTRRQAIQSTGVVLGNHSFAQMAHFEQLLAHFAVAFAVEQQ